MSKNENERIKLLLIWDILKNYSDEAHPLSTQQIIEKLNEKGYFAERKGIYSAINLLNQYGFEVFTNKSSQNEYFVEDKIFDNAELKILFDAVQGASFLTEKKTKILTEKIAKLAGSSKEKLLNDDILYIETNKLKNEHIFYIVDSIHTSINNRKKVSFNYFDYDVDKKRVLRKDGQRYTVNPVSLVYSEDKYYLVCYHDKYQNLTNYRVDRMLDVKEENEDIMPSDCVRGYNAKRHKKQSFSMYKGEEKDVEIKIARELFDVVVDKFGEDVKTSKIDENFIKIKVRVQISPTFYAWCFTFGKKLKILSPTEVAESMKSIARDVLEEL